MSRPAINRLDSWKRVGGGDRAAVEVETPGAKIGPVLRRSVYESSPEAVLLRDRNL